MRSIQSFSSSVLADIVRRQSPSPGRTAFAWQLAVGPQLARVTSVEMEGSTLRVTATDPRWLREIEAATGTILPRLQQMLGRETVRKITTR